MSAGLVSVIVPTFNRADCLSMTLESVLAQSYGDVEIVLVDDGSTDGTRDLVRDRWGADPRVHYLYQPNAGVSAARNLGLRNARGAYIALLDSDDVWLPWKLEAQLACLARFPEAGMVWTDMAAVGSAGEVVNPMYLRTFYHAYTWFTPEQLFSTVLPVGSLMDTVPVELRARVVRYGDIYSPMIMGNLVHTSTVLMRRSRFEQVQRFNESMKTGEDYDFHLRTCRAGPVAFLEAAAIHYRIGRSDRLTRPELSLQIGRNFLRTIEPVIEQDRARITLPDWMVDRTRADGHRWVGEAALAADLQSEARFHLAISLRLRPWQPRVALLLAAALAPPAVNGLLRKGVRLAKRMWHRIAA